MNVIHPASAPCYRPREYRVWSQCLFVPLIAILGCGRFGYDDPDLKLTAPETPTTPTSLSSPQAPSLSSLLTSGGSFVPSFSPDIFSYTIDVPNATDSISLTPVTENATNIISINGVEVTPNIPPAPLALSVGSNPISIEVRSVENATRVYTVDVRRAASSPPALLSLNISSGNLSPTFASNTFSYTDAVENAVSSITLTPMIATGSSVTVDGQLVSTGNASQNINLNIGLNTVTVSVTDSIGTTVDYTINITRAAIVSGPSLSTLALSAGMLSPSFAQNITAYSASVAFFDAAISVTPTSNSVTDTITINGTATLSGVPFAVPLANLSPAANTITIVLTDLASNITTYTLSVTRDAASALGYTILKASNPDSSDAFGTTIAIDGDTLVVGAPHEGSSATGINGNQSDNSAAGAGAVYVFQRTAGVWSQQAYIKASNAQANDFFGGAVALSGDTLVVGANNEDSSATGINGNQSDNSASASGAVYVFTRSGSTWSQQAYIKASNTEAGDIFGDSVEISGDTLVVSASNESSNATGINGNQTNNFAPNSGAAYVFTRSGSTWSQQAYIKASNTGPGDVFATSIAIDGDSLIVGAIGEGSSATGINGNQSDNSAVNSGAAYVFTRTGSTWSQQAYIKASNTDAGDWFGSSVAIFGDTIVIGAERESGNATGVNGNPSDNSAAGAGAAYVYTRSGNTWSQQAYIKASNTDANDNFGYSVALLGETLVIGARRENSNATGINGNQANNSAASAGAAYAYTRSGTTWSPQYYIKASNTQALDFFATSTALSGGVLGVGSPGENSTAAGSGAVYIIK